MNRNRAPKGIPAGGQFTATEHAEPASLMRPALARADRALNAVGDFADYVESRHQREMAEIRDNPIIWRDLLPKFLRRKRS